MTVAAEHVADPETKAGLIAEHIAMAAAELKARWLLERLLWHQQLNNAFGERVDAVSKARNAQPGF